MPLPRQTPPLSDEVRLPLLTPVVSVPCCIFHFFHSLPRKRCLNYVFPSESMVVMLGMRGQVSQEGGRMK